MDLVTGDIVKDVPLIDAEDLEVFVNETEELSSSTPIHLDLVFPLACVSG